MIDAALEERERHIALDLENLCKTLLETTAVLDKVGNVAPGQGVVQHLQEDLVQEGEEVALDQVPDHWAQQVEDVGRIRESNIRKLLFYIRFYFISIYTESPYLFRDISPSRW